MKKLTKNSKFNRTRAKKYNIFLDLWENITPSLALLLKLTPICCFAIFLALARSRADPRGSRTITLVVFFKTLCSIKLVFFKFNPIYISFFQDFVFCFFIFVLIFRFVEFFIFTASTIFNFFIHFSFLHSSSPLF